MKIRICETEDLDQLAEWNRHLIEDEGSDNPMTVDALRVRMAAFLNADYTAYFFSVNATVVGYALVDRARQPLYLRQFFISRTARRRGYGTSAFALLLRELKVAAIDIDVLSANERGLAFWTSLGFSERSRTLRYNRS